MSEKHNPCLYERELGAIGADLKTLKLGQKNIVDLLKTQNERVRKNEVKISYIFGALAVLGIAIAIVRLL